uniref:Uncharacterized protein n=1 Tax=Anguilla anguilla TaxID=7936 RepID=A0A0E9RXA0_ANGAN
MDKLIKAENLL